ncbi:MAG: hypothetical protein EHM36_09035 [Deltaproteobacteria bacterium]|nr:MAG: hypothetical protein EHM36_09035 [Deltaproteobacteria bacterium]
MENIFFFVVLMLAALAGVFFIQSLLVKRAISQVIRIFCQHIALGVRNAKTIEDLGLTPPNLIQRMTMLRDYKPYALQILQQAGVIHMTDDGKLYMTEEKLKEDMRCGMEWQQT